MADSSTPKRGLAIVAGAAFTAGAIVVIFGETLRNPSEWTTYHLITLLTICGTIVVGHLVGSAARAGGFGGWLSAIGFCVLFLAGTGLVIYQSLGRQAEAAGSKVASAEHRNGLIASKLQQRDKTLQDLDDHKQRIAAEVAGWPNAKGKATKTPGCGPDCRGFERQRDAAQALIDRLEREIADLGPQVEVAPELREVQLLRTMFFEFGSIVAFAFGFGHRKTSARSFSGTFSESFSDEDQEPTPPSGPKRKTKQERLPANVIQFKHPVVRVLENVGRPVTNGELARLMGVSDGEASKRWREVAHLLEVARAGKERRITLKRLAAA
jgi:hypothetical protein